MFIINFLIFYCNFMGETQKIEFLFFYLFATNKLHPRRTLVRLRVTLRFSLSILTLFFLSLHPDVKKFRIQKIDILKGSKNKCFYCPFSYTFLFYIKPYKHTAFASVSKATVRNKFYFCFFKIIGIL